MGRKIVVGYERTPQGEDALALATVLAETLNAGLIVATVLPWARHLMGHTDLEKALETESEKLFAGVREKLAPVVVETRALASASAPRALFELAESEGAVAIVLGSTHRGVVGRVLPGTVGTALLQGAPCAVAVAPAGYAEDEVRHLLSVGAAFDGSSESWTALETAIGLAERLHARLSVFTVAEPPHYGYATSFAVMSAGELHDFELEDKRRVHELALRRVPEELPVEGRIMRGNAGANLAEASADVDLLVIGSRAYGPIRRTFLGSASARVIHAASSPVLVLPRGAGADPLDVCTPAERRQIEQPVGTSPTRSPVGVLATLASQQPRPVDP